MLLVAVAPFAASQTPVASQPPTEVVAFNTHPDLPDSPGFLLTGTSSSLDNTSGPADPENTSADQTQTQATPPRHSAHLQMTISPNEIAEPMTVHEKVVGGLKDSVSLFSALGWFAAAGWEHAWNDSPNYGTDSGAFGQRLGAAAVRGISEGVFSESFFAPVFHEDPRYYIMGPGHSFFKRAIYAGTRVLITRTDSGRTTPNFALIAGNAAGSALTVTYYPQRTPPLPKWRRPLAGPLAAPRWALSLTNSSWMRWLICTSRSGSPKRPSAYYEI